MAERQAVTRAGLTGISLAGAVAIAIALRYKPAHLDDFLPFYRAAGLVGTPDVFAQTAFHARGLMFLRTPLYAWVLRPLTALDYPHARALWIALMAVGFCLAVWTWPAGRSRLMVAICWTLPTLFALALGQDIALVLLIGAAAARLWTGGREFAAGAVASLLAIKITFLFPVAIVFLARSRRGLAGLAAGAAVHFAASWLIQGPGWIPEYVAAVRSPMLDLAPSQMPSVRAFSGGVLYAVMACLIYGWLWYSARRAKTPADAMAVGLALAVIAAPHSYAYDMAAATPLLAAVASAQGLPGIAATIALSPAPYLLIVFAPGSLVGAALIVAAVMVGSTAVLHGLRVVR